MLTELLNACTIISFGKLLTSKSEGRFKSISLCQTRPTIVYVNSDETPFYSFTTSIDKCVGSCNTINDPYDQFCVPNKVKNMNLKVCNLMSEVNVIKSQFIMNCVTLNVD